VEHLRHSWERLKQALPLASHISTRSHYCGATGLGAKDLVLLVSPQRSPHHNHFTSPFAARGFLRLRHSRQMLDSGTTSQRRSPRKHDLSIALDIGQPHDGEMSGPLAFHCLRVAGRWPPPPALFRCMGLNRPLCGLVVVKSSTLCSCS
jgi:hypothetical protein